MNEHEHYHQTSGTCLVCTLRTRLDDVNAKRRDLGKELTKWKKVIAFLVADAGGRMDFDRRDVDLFEWEDLILEEWCDVQKNVYVLQVKKKPEPPCRRCGKPSPRGDLCGDCLQWAANLLQKSMKAK